MVWWFLLVSSSYLYIWLVTDNQDTLTSGVLIPTGISAATGLSTAVLGGSSAPAKAPEPVDDAPPPPPPEPPTASKGFLMDLLADANGLSFDRLQMAAWTVILGIVFIKEVLRDLSMPDFNTTLLGLMGISSGTYVGFKLPDSKS